MKDIVQLFLAVDSKDTEKFVSYLTEDAVFVLGNNPAVKGKEAIKSAVAGFFSSIQSLSHSDLRFYEDKDNNTVTVQGMVKYVRKDDSELSVPFCNVFIFKGDLISEYFVYVDMHELFS